jgi:dTDP-D-glucose 4,6-dehydratase
MLAGMAVAQGKIVLNSDGLSWRPNLHILDLCESIRCCLEWEYNGGELMVLNVGDEKDNWSIIDIAREIHNAVPESKLSFLKENPELDTKGFIRDRKVQQSDTRTYRVSFAKIKKLLPKFRCRWNLTTGIPDLISWLQTNNLTEKDFLSRKYYRLQQLEYLIEKGKLTQDLRWKIPTYKKVR